MDEILGFLSQGFLTIFQPEILLYIVAGTVIGLVVGAIPGLGVQLAFAIIIPFTFVTGAEGAVALLMSVTVAIMFGNSIPAVLVGVPGSPAAILTVLDGYQLHRQGRSSLALAVSLFAALVGQGTSVVFFVFAVIPLAVIAYSFLTPEMFALYMLGIVAIVSLAGRNIVKGAIAAVFGLLISMVGLDPVSGVARFTFDLPELRSGLSVPAITIGLLAVSELFRQSRQAFSWKGERARMPKFPKLRELIPAVPGTFIGSVVGTFVGAIPGAGSTPAALISYQTTQLVSREPEKFGKGSVPGLAANESAQNSANSGELIPTLGLGIPGSGSMVLLLAALSINGFIAGPSLIREAPQLLEATVAGLLGATLLLFILGWPLAKVVGKALTVNRALVVVFGLVITAIGVYSLRQRVLDVFVCYAAGAVGYFMMRYGYSTAATALAVVLGSAAESALRRGLNLFDSSPVQFFSRPITAAVTLAAIAFLVIGVRRTLKVRKQDLGLDTTSTRDPNRSTPVPTAPVPGKDHPKETP